MIRDIFARVYDHITGRPYRDSEAYRRSRDSGVYAAAGPDRRKGQSDVEANQRSTAGSSETLVSDDRGQLTGGPTLPLGGLAAIVVAAIVFENFATTAGPQLCQETVRGCSSDPTGQLLLLGAALLAVPLVGLGTYLVRSRGGDGE